jgi:hypothetical protein
LVATIVDTLRSPVANTNKCGEGITLGVMSFHVGHSPTRLYIIMGRRCSHVLKHKPSSNHVMAICLNVEHHGHGHVSVGSRLVEITREPTPSLVTGKEVRLVGGLGFERM